MLDSVGGKSKIEMTVSGLNMGGGSDVPGAQKSIQKMAKDSEGSKITQMFDTTGKPTGPKDPKAKSMQASLAGLNVDTGFFGLTYPDKPVSPGETWTHTIDYRNVLNGFPQMGSVTWTNPNVVTTFTLRSVDKSAGTAVIGISSKGNPVINMKMPGRPPAPNGKASGAAPQDFKMSMMVNGTGTATVDLATGIPKEIVFETATEFTNPMGGGNMSQKTKGTVKRQ